MIDRLLPLVDTDDPDLKAVDRLVKAIDLQARLGGVYRPDPPAMVLNRVDVTVTALEEHGRRLWATRLASSTATAAPTGVATGELPVVGGDRHRRQHR